MTVSEPDAGEEAKLIDLLERIAINLDHQGGGLRNTRMQMLRSLADAGRRGLTQAALAERLRLSHPAISRLCDEMERDRLIARDSHQFDRRKKTLRLTPEGFSQLETCGAALNAAGVRATHSLSDGDIGVLTGLLARIDANLRGVSCNLACDACQIGGC